MLLNGALRTAVQNGGHSRGTAIEDVLRIEEGKPPRVVRDPVLKNTGPSVLLPAGPHARAPASSAAARAKPSTAPTWSVAVTARTEATITPATRAESLTARTWAKSLTASAWAKSLTHAAPAKSLATETLASKSLASKSLATETTLGVSGHRRSRRAPPLDGINRLLDDERIQAPDGHESDRSRSILGCVVEIAHDLGNIFVKSVGARDENAIGALVHADGEGRGDRVAVGVDVAVYVQPSAEPSAGTEADLFRDGIGVQLLSEYVLESLHNLAGARGF
jgi:hypothetical protein